MLSFYTVMVLTYTLEGERLQSKILFPSSQACSDALPDYQDHLYQFDRGAMAACDVTDLPSKSIRPRARPTTTTTP